MRASNDDIHITHSLAHHSPLHTHTHTHTPPPPQSGKGALAHNIVLQIRHISGKFISTPLKVMVGVMMVVVVIVVVMVW